MPKELEKELMAETWDRWIEEVLIGEGCRRWHLSGGRMVEEYFGLLAKLNLGLRRSPLIFTFWHYLPSTGLWNTQVLRCYRDGKNLWYGERNNNSWTGPRLTLAEILREDFPNPSSIDGLSIGLTLRPLGAWRVQREEWEWARWRNRTYSSMTGKPPHFPCHQEAPTGFLNLEGWNVFKNSGGLQVILKGNLSRDQNWQMFVEWLDPTERIFSFNVGSPSNSQGRENKKIREKLVQRVSEGVRSVFGIDVSLEGLLGRS